jgi:hypothetical protein
MLNKTVSSQIFRQVPASSRDLFGTPTDKRIPRLDYRARYKADLGSGDRANVAKRRI